MRWSNNCCTVIECLSHFTGCKYWQCKSESVPQYCIQYWILRNANILSADRTQCSSTFCRTLLYLDSCTLVSWDLSYVLLSTLPLWECEAVLMLYLECRVLRHYEGQCAAQPRQPQRHEADRCIRTCCHSFASFDNFAQWSCRPLGFTVRPGSALFWLPVGIWSQTVLCCSLLKASIIG